MVTSCQYMLIIISGAGQRAKDEKGVWQITKLKIFAIFFFKIHSANCLFVHFVTTFISIPFPITGFQESCHFYERKTEWWWSIWQIICECIFPSFLKWCGNISAPGFANGSNFIDYMASWSWGRLNQIDWLLLASQDFAPWTALTKTVMMIICCEFSFSKAGKF